MLEIRHCVCVAAAVRLGFGIRGKNPTIVWRPRAALVILEPSANMGKL